MCCRLYAVRDICRTGLIKTKLSIPKLHVFCVLISGIISFDSCSTDHFAQFSLYFNSPFNMSIYSKTHADQLRVMLEQETKKKPRI